MTDFSSWFALKPNQAIVGRCIFEVTKNHELTHVALAYLSDGQRVVIRELFSDVEIVDKGAIIVEAHEQHFDELSAIPSPSALKAILAPVPSVIKTLPHTLLRWLDRIPEYQFGEDGYVIFIDSGSGFPNVEGIEGVSYLCRLEDRYDDDWLVYEARNEEVAMEVANANRDYEPLVLRKDLLIF